MHSNVDMGHLKTGVDRNPEMSVIQNIPHILDNLQNNITTMNRLLSQDFRQQSRSPGEYILYSSLKSLSVFYVVSTGMCHITSFRSTLDHIYDGGPVRL